MRSWRSGRQLLDAGGDSRLFACHSTGLPVRLSFVGEASSEATFPATVNVKS
jgi:hypothetical protein